MHHFSGGNMDSAPATDARSANGACFQIRETSSPGNPGPETISCACGCGKSFTPRKQGRRQRFYDPSHRDAYHRKRRRRAREVLDLFERWGAEDRSSQPPSGE